MKKGTVWILAAGLAVSAAIFEENKDGYLPGECVAEGHIILETEEKDSQLKAFVLSRYGEYGFQDGNFVKVSGSKDVDRLFGK